MMRSIRSRILGALLILLTVALSIMSWRSYADARIEIEEVFDAQLTQSARMLAVLAHPAMTPQEGAAVQQALRQAATLSEQSPAFRHYVHEYESKLAFVVFRADGSLILASPSAPVQQLDSLRQLRESGALHASPQASPGTDGQTLLPGLLPGYYEVRQDDWDWRIYLHHDPAHGSWVLVGDRADVRSVLATRIASRSLWVELLGIPLLLLLVWLVVGWGLRPLEQLAESLRQRGPQQLEPVQLRAAPAELQAVLQSLNGLLGQVTEARERERRFLSYAAHELRTPLAVLHVQAHNALHAPDPADREAAIRQIDRNVVRATHLSEQLLLLARLEPGLVRLQRVALDLAAFLRQELAELITLSLQRDQELTLQVQPGERFVIHADEQGLHSLVENLVANAIRHTPPGGQIQVVLERQSDGIRLRFQDSGPGIAPELRERVFEHFFRQGAGQGAGLGLAIVARVAELHDWRLLLHDSPLGGLEVCVCLPMGEGSAGSAAAH